MKILNRIIKSLSTLSRKGTYTPLLFLYLAIACDSEDANNCLQTDGNTINYVVELPSFTKIQMENDIRVVLIEGPEQLVSIETGENLVSDLDIKVTGETLVLQNNNGCNFLRDFGATLVTIVSPNITFIRQASSFSIKSQGVLTYPNLLVWSNTSPSEVGIDDPNKSGGVQLELDTESFSVFANGSSNFIITGRADTANLIFSDEFPQLDARNFLVDNLSLSQVSAALLIVNPQNSITGEIRATGDVISVNRPETVNVEEFFTGRLIFE